VERIGVAVADRAAALEEHRAAGVALPAAAEESYKLLARVRRFLGLAVI
jgi:hypothetical protein